MDIAVLAAGVLRKDRRSLARAITLVESARADHRAQAVALLGLVRSAPGGSSHALRIGLSGTPGVGKSTFIESFGLMLTARGLRVAVLAVDPSSTRTGGSILGDKTRMERLSRNSLAFIRPSPSQTQLGGIARRSREAVALCEAAGFDVVLIETVGVGQSETMVAQLCDLFVLLLAPAGGDELQGVKRGIMEMADLILVNKADGDLVQAAQQTCGEYAGALRLLRRRVQDPAGFPKVMTISALQETGLAAVWSDLQLLADWRRLEGHFSKLRAEQDRHWFEEEVRNGLLGALNREPARGIVRRLGADVVQGLVAAETAAAQALTLLGKTPW